MRTAVLRPARLGPPDLAVLAFIFEGLRADFCALAVLPALPLYLAGLPAGVLAAFSGDLFPGGFLLAAPRSTWSMALPTCGIEAMPSTERSTL